MEFMVGQFNLFYMHFVKWEDLEINKTIKFDYFAKKEVFILIVKTKYKKMICFESMYKKEDLEKLKIWYKNKLWLQKEF